MLRKGVLISVYIASKHQENVRLVWKLAEFELLKKSESASSRALEAISWSFSERVTSISEDDKLLLERLEEKIILCLAFNAFHEEKASRIEEEHSEDAYGRSLVHTIMESKYPKTVGYFLNPPAPATTVPELFVNHFRKKHMELESIRDDSSKAAVGGVEANGFLRLE